jgi:hypothetical protein
MGPPALFACPTDGWGISMPQEANGYRLDVGVPELRPLRIGEILDVAIKITTKHFGQLVRIVAAVIVPYWVIASLVLVTTVPGGALFATADNPASGVDPDEVAVFSTSVVVVALLAFFIRFLVFAACFRAVSDAYLHRAPSWRASLRTGLRRTLPMAGTGILWFLGVSAASFALLIPGIWLAVAWSLFPPALVAEKIGGPAALGRSFNLVRGRWWPTFGVWFLFLLVIWVLNSILNQAVLSVVFSDFGSAFAFVVLLAVAGIISELIVTPFGAAVVTVLYYDLRVRKEGLDIELMAQAAGSPVSGAAPNLPPPPGYGPPPGAVPPPPLSHGDQGTSAGT